jgi:general secretion pathway protein I
MSAARREAGSALVEAMVAVAIIAMMLAVTYRAVGESVLRSRAAEASRTAAMIAQSRLALVGSEIPLTPGETTGVDGDFAWRIEIDSTEEDASAMGHVLAVTASVRGASGRADRAVLRTLRLAPAG